jgi:hypothetical protein
MPNTAPAVVDEDASTGEATLTWYFEMGVDKNYYAETLFPLVNKCLDAIMGSAPAKMEIQLQHATRQQAKFFGHPNSFDSFPVKQSNATIPTLHDPTFNGKAGGAYKSPFIFIKSLSRNFDSIDIVCYPTPQHSIEFQSSGKSFPDGYPALAALSVQIFASDRDKLASNLVPAWQPFSTAGSKLSMVGPFSDCFGGLYLISPIIQKVAIKVPIDMLKEIKKVDVSLQTLEVKLTLQPNRN